MRVLKQAVEAAAAAALATSFFAFPIALAAMDVDLPVSTAPGTPDRVVHVDAAGLLLLAGEAPAAEEPPAPPTEETAADAAEAAPTEPAEAAADAPDPAPAIDAPTSDVPLAVRTPTARKFALRPLQADDARTARRGGAKGRRGKQKKCLEADPRIQAKGDDRFRIERDLVDAYTSDLKTASKLAWVGWHRDGEGEIDGFRVKRIRCGSVLHQAGFRNGDVIHTVNGKPVTSIPQALSAYRKLRKKRTLHVEVERKGVLRKLRYRLS